MVSHWSLSDNKSPQVPKTHLIILADHINGVIWMVFTRPLIFKSSTPYTNPLVTVPRSPIGINVSFMFHGFFNDLVRPRYLSFFSFSFNFTLRSIDPVKSTYWHVLFFLLMITRSGRLAEIRWSVCISKSQRSSCVSFSRTDSGLCIYHLYVWSNFNFLHNSQWITMFIQLYLALYSFCANLLHSFIMWLGVSSLPPHNLHLLFLLCLIYSCFDMIDPYGVLCCY